MVHLALASAFLLTILDVSGAVSSDAFLQSNAARRHRMSLLQMSDVFHSLDTSSSHKVVDDASDSGPLCMPPTVGGCELLNSSSFLQQFDDGKKAVAHKGIVLAGLMRDDGPATSTLLSALHTVGKAFSRHQLIILENDSKDGTRQNMEVFCQGKNAWCFELKMPSLKTKQDAGVPHRVQHLTNLRQQLLKQVRRFVSQSHHKWEFMLMFDGDLFSDGNAGFNPSTMLAMFGYRQYNEALFADHPPDVVCSNGIMSYHGNNGRFRDTFALRRSSFHEKQTSGKDDFFFKGNSLVQVKSCFSGLALYSLPAILKSKCDYKYEGEGTCEHVVFHRCLASKGHRRAAIYPPWTVRNINSLSELDPQACRQPDLSIRGCKADGTADETGEDRADGDNDSWAESDDSVDGPVDGGDDDQAPASTSESASN